MNNGKDISISLKNKLYLNFCNLAFFLIVTFTGSVIQIQYHMHRLSEAYVIIGLNKIGWTLLHKASAFIFFAGLMVHCLVNWRFVATSTKRIFEGNQTPFSSNSYLLFLISTFACLTAVTSWFLFGGAGRVRFALVETHDKLGWLLVIFGIIHISSRIGRMFRTFRKVREKAIIGKNRTEYICFDSGKCKACWKCIEVCPKNVFGKINILIHKHIRIVRSKNCIGCLKCVNACNHGAIDQVV